MSKPTHEMIIMANEIYESVMERNGDTYEAMAQALEFILNMDQEEYEN